MVLKKRKFFCLGALAILMLLSSAQSLLAETMVLKVLAINPSKDKEQEVPIKTYLPAEAKPEIVLNRDELQIGFDTEKSLYYVEKKVKIKPGESYTMKVEMEDIWVIPNESLESVEVRADTAIRLLEEAVAYDVAKLLHDNILQTIKIVRGHQDSLDPLPQEHIANYRLDLKLLDQARKDLATIEEMAKNPQKRKVSSREEKGPGGHYGSIAFSWKLILTIIAFLALLSFGCFLVWEKQLKSLVKIKDLEIKKTKFSSAESLEQVEVAEKSGQSEEKLAALYKDAEKMAGTDELTGLNNRRHLMDALKAKIEAAEISRVPFFLTILDIDHFKRYNDEHGHNFGDQVIVAVAREAKANMGDNCYLARYGGDEFVAVVDKASREDVEKRLARVRNAIRSMELHPAKDKTAKVSVSFGVVKYEVGKGIDGKSLIGLADEQLLSVKQTERGHIGMSGQ